MSSVVTVGQADDGQRLDRWLKKNFPDLSFGEMQKIIRTGQLRVNGKRVKGDARLQAGQEVRIPPQMSAAARGEKTGPSQKESDFIRGLVLYEDDDIIALNKPAGLATQGGTKIKKHIDGFLPALAREGEKPHLVHRLDRDTSGVLLLARNARVARAMGDVFRDRDIRKYYWAITLGTPDPFEGRVRAAIAKVRDGDGERMATVDDEDPEGKSALTYYTTLESIGAQYAFVAFWPRTGRTHQIRVHAAEIGCPLLGDFKYGCTEDDFSDPALPRVLHLHARRVIFRHPRSGKKIDITAPLGMEMKKTFRFFGLDERRDDPFENIE